MALRRAIAGGGTIAFAGYGDLSLTELLPAILTRYSETHLLIAAPSLPEQATETIGEWMRKTWARMDGRGRLWCVGRLTLVTSVEQSPAVAGWLDGDAFDGRLTVVDREQADTCILLPDFAVTGPVNMRYGEHFTAEATTEKDRLDALREKFMPKEEPDAETPEEEDTGNEGQPGAEAKPKPRAQQKKKKDAE